MKKWVIVVVMLAFLIGSFKSIGNEKRKDEIKYMSVENIDLRLSALDTLDRENESIPCIGYIWFITDTKGRLHIAIYAKNITHRWPENVKVQNFTINCTIDTTHATAYRGDVKVCVRSGEWDYTHAHPLYHWYTGGGIENPKRCFSIDVNERGKERWYKTLTVPVEVPDIKDIKEEIAFMIMTIQYSHKARPPINIDWAAVTLIK